MYSKGKSRKKDLGFIALMIFASSIVLFFRIYQINEIPSEMFSDHAEKLLDVMDVLRGDFPVFFIRNTGREGIQFYVTAMIIKIFDTDLDFLSLKIGTIIFGLLTLPFIFLIAKDQSNKWGGLFAFLLAGIGYWPNVISRVGLRYSLYPLFTAPVLYFLIRGLKERNYNLFLLSGLFLGLGLHGYSSSRILPILVVIVIFLYLLNKESAKFRFQAMLGLGIVGIGALSVFLPLLRYWFDHPGSFSYRSLSRITQIERSFNAPAFILFMKNFLDSIIMPFYKNGQIWVHSVPNRPALDFISAGFLFVGVISLIYKIKKQRRWEAGILLVSIPVLMMPSILSLAFPGENPSLNRSAGALVPIFVVVGIGFHIFSKAIINSFPKRISRIISGSVGVIIVLISIKNNYHIVFKEYREQFDKNAWNSSEIGDVIKNF
ncbi:MAG: glycosyltransferase family 39 protein, partial [Promethearchaeota archaeon]